MPELPCGCIDLWDENDPPEVQVKGLLIVPGCPVHDPDGEALLGQEGE